MKYPRAWFGKVCLWMAMASLCFACQPEKQKKGLLDDFAAMLEARAPLYLEYENVHWTFSTTTKIKVLVDAGRLLVFEDPENGKVKALASNEVKIQVMNERKEDVLIVTAGEAETGFKVKEILLKKGVLVDLGETEMEFDDLTFKPGEETAYQAVIETGTEFQSFQTKGKVRVLYESKILSGTGFNASANFEHFQIALVDGMLDFND